MHHFDLIENIKLHSFCHRLSDHLYCTNRCIDVGSIDWSLLTGCTHGHLQGGQNRHLPTWKLGIRTKNF